MNEVTQLQYLHNFDFNSVVIPKILGTSNDGIIELSNIKPKKYSQNLKITNLHIRY